MSGIAGIVHWDGRPVAEGDLGRMLRAIRHRGPDDLEGKVAESVALGHARLAVRVVEREQAQPVWMPDRSCAIVADARLYNREHLSNSLGRVEWVPHPASDATLLLAAYERWGIEMLQRINGDFAFAIWDAGERQIFAARDPFGIKPFFFWADGGGFRFGSEPKQLLILAEVAVEPEEQVVVEHLLDKPTAGELTFFKGVHRLRAGHFLNASADGVAQRAYWEPRGERVELATEEDHVARFRELFRQAIASRVDAEEAVGAQLSGGLDSSSVTAMAAQIYREDGPSLPEMSTLSETYSGFPCDESPYIEVMTGWLPFDAQQVDCSTFDLPLSIEDELWKEDGPTAELVPDRTLRTSQALSSFGARVLLTGYGGDELTWDPEWAPDLLRKGQFVSAYQQAWRLSRLPEESALPAILRRAVVHSIPNGLRRWLVAIRPRAAEPWPDHVKTGLDRYLGGGEEPPMPRAEFPSIAQQTVYRWLSDPLLHWNLERLEQRYASRGRELRHPFFDRRLAELVLAIPFDKRVGPPGLPKALLRQAMQGLLLTEILERRTQAVFDTYFLAAWERWRPYLREVIHSSDPWLSEPYTDPKRVRPWLESALPESPHSMEVLSQAWAAVNLELWLRGLGRYSAAQYDEASQSLGEVDHA